MKIQHLIIALLFLLPASLPGQEFCRRILEEGWTALEAQGSLTSVLDLLQAAETCDYEDALLEGPGGRQALEKAIFEAINRQKEAAEIARAEAIRQQRIAESQQAVAQRRALEAKSAALAAKSREQLPEDPTIAFNLAIAAYDTARTPQAGSALSAVLGDASHVFYSFRKQMPVRNYLPNFEDIIDDATDDSDNIDTPLSFLSPDGSIIVLPGKGDTTWVLDVRANEPLFFLEEQYIKPGEVLFSPDAALLLTCEVDKQSCKLWDLEKERMGAFRKSWEDVEAAAFSPGGSKLALLTGKTIKIWNSAEDEVVARSLEGPLWNIEKVAVSEDGKKMLTYDGDRDSLFVWNWAAGDTLAAYSGGAPQSISFSADGQKVLVVSHSTVRILDASQAASLQVLRKVLPELTAEEERQIALMDGEGETVFEPVVLSGQFSPDGSKVLTLTRRMMLSYEINVWDAVTGKILHELKGLKGMTYSACFSPDGSQVITNSGMFFIREEEDIPDIEPEVIFWDLQRWNRPLLELEDPPAKIRDLVFFSEGKDFITLPGEAAPRVWDMQTGKEQLSGLQTAASTALQLVSADTLWEIKPDGRLSGRPLLGGLVYHTAVSSDGTVVAGVTTSGDLYLWKTRSPETPYRIVEAHPSYINRVVITSDNQKVITGGDYGRIRVWDIHDGRQLGGWQAYPDGQTDMTFDVSPDGKWIATASNGGVVKLWEVASQREFESWSPLDNSFDIGALFPALKGTPYIQGRVEKTKVEVTCVRFSNDSARLLIAAEDEEIYPVKIWDIPTKTVLFSLEGHDEPVTQAVFSPDDTRILTLDDYSNVFIWMNPVAGFRNGHYHRLSAAQITE